MITRRNFCAGVAVAIAAPYIVRNSGVLMPVKDRSLRLMYAINTNADPWPPRKPLGAIYPFLGKPPKGWLPFDGRTIRREQYPELFRVANWSKQSEIKLRMFDPDGINQPCLGRLNRIERL